MLPGLKTVNWKGVVKDGRKENQGRKKAAKDLQTPVVSKGAQHAEHYAFSNSKCCWQAGWLLAGERLSASLLQIQTSCTVDICNGTTDNTAALQPHGRPDRTAQHTINDVHAVFTENATFFYIPILTRPSFVSHFWNKCFERGMMLLSLLDVDSADYAI